MVLLASSIMQQGACAPQDMAHLCVSSLPEMVSGSSWLVSSWHSTPRWLGMFLLSGSPTNCLLASLWAANTASCCLICAGARESRPPPLPLLLLAALPAATTWRHRTRPSGATCLAYCFTSVGLTRILLPLQRGVASTCTGEQRQVT